jgi:outer membrane biogenesis lipoprotein LolB
MRKLEEDQLRLNEDIQSLNDWIKRNNTDSQCTNLDLEKINTSCSIKKTKRGIKYRTTTFSDKNMYDGLHGNMPLKEKWHKRTTEVVYQELAKRLNLNDV